jgi:hypothetical protein
MEAGNCVFPPEQGHATGSTRGPSHPGRLVDRQLCQPPRLIAHQWKQCIQYIGIESAVRHNESRPACLPPLLLPLLASHTLDGWLNIFLPNDFTFHC